MFLIRILRWLRGTVTFLITGAFPERLVNLCVRARLPLWDVIPKGPGCCRASTYAESYRRIRPLARKSGVRVRIESKKGWPFTRHRYRRRWGIAAGAALAAAVMLFLPTRIWSIEVNGCEEISKEEIVLALSEMGLTLGVRARSVDAHELERRMMLADDRIAWIAVNIVTSTAQIEIRERVMPPEPIDPKDRAANVVAACDGQLKSLQVYAGQPLVKVGDTVRKGEIIVSGVMQDGHGNVRLTFARAKAVAQTYEEFTVQLPLEQSELVADGETVVSRELRLFGLRIPLSLPKGRLSPLQSRSIQVISLLNKPSVELVATQITPMRRKAVTLDEFAAKELAMRQLALLRPQSTADVAVLRREFEGICENGIYCLTERALVEKDIAKQVEILIR